MSDLGLEPDEATVVMKSLELADIVIGSESARQSEAQQMRQAPHPDPACRSDYDSHRPEDDVVGS